MPTKKPATSKPKAKPAPPPPKAQLQNLARPPVLDETLDDQLVDHSGVFRVTAGLAKAQAGHGEDANMRFPNDSLVMAAQRDGFRDAEPTIDEFTDDHLVEDESTAAEKRQRLATLAARHRAQQTRPRR